MFGSLEVLHLKDMQGNQEQEMIDAMNSLGHYTQHFTNDWALSIKDAPSKEIQTDRKIHARHAAYMIQRFVLPVVRPSLRDGGAAIEIAIARVMDACKDSIDEHQRCAQCPAAKKIDALAEALAAHIIAQKGGVR